VRPLQPTTPLIVSDDVSNRVEEARAQAYHRIVMQILYLSQRARPNLRLAVSSLRRRVTKCNEDDWKKLGRVIMYLKDTIDLPLRLQSDGSGNLYWYVDASFAVHPGMKGHTGDTLTMGSGSTYRMATAQKLMARSSTESELIGCCHRCCGRFASLRVRDTRCRQLYCTRITRVPRDWRRMDWVPARNGHVMFCCGLIL
jgi:hypothetical protein